MQPELIEACKEKGVATSGTKEKLASNLLAFFATAGSNAAALPGNSADDMQLLSSRVAELDQAIQTRTEELQSLHDGDRYAIEFLYMPQAANFKHHTSAEDLRRSFEHATRQHDGRLREHAGCVQGCHGEAAG